MAHSPVLFWVDLCSAYAGGPPPLAVLKSHWNIDRPSLGVRDCPHMEPRDRRVLLITPVSSRYWTATRSRATPASHKTRLVWRRIGLRGGAAGVQELIAAKQGSASPHPVCRMDQTDQDVQDRTIGVRAVCWPVCPGYGTVSKSLLDRFHPLDRWSCN